jgi:hypothetical protein
MGRCDQCYQRKNGSRLSKCDPGEKINVDCIDWKCDFYSRFSFCGSGFKIRLTYVIEIN